MRASSARPYKVAGGAVYIRRTFLCVILRAATEPPVRISTEARGRGRGVYTPNFFLRHPEACNKAGREDLDRGNRPRARYVYAELFSASSRARPQSRAEWISEDTTKCPRRYVRAELFETNVTSCFAKVGCKHTAPRAYGARRDSFVALCCAPQNDAGAVVYSPSRDPKTLCVLLTKTRNLLHVFARSTSQTCPRHVCYARVTASEVSVTGVTARKRASPE